MSNLCCSSDLNSREQETLQPVHVINVDIQDNHEEATLGAFLICELCQCVSVSHQYFLSNVVHWRWRQAALIAVWRVLPLLTLQIEHTEDMENEIEELLQEFEEKSKRPFLHTVCFYWRTSQTRNKPNQITISSWTHTHAPHSSVYSNVRKQLSCKHSIFRSGCQEWLLMDRMVGTLFFLWEDGLAALPFCLLLSDRLKSSSIPVMEHHLSSPQGGPQSSPLWISVSFEDHSWSVKII